MLTQILLILALILCNAFFAMSEIAVVSSKKSKIAVKSSKGNKKAKILLNTMKNPSRFFATIQVGITLAGFFASAQAAVKIGVYLQKPLESIFASTQTAYNVSVVIITILISYITLVLGELVPKRLANTFPEEISLAVIKPIKIIEKILMPFIFLLTKSTEFIVKILGLNRKKKSDDISEEEIKVMANTGFKRGVLNLNEKNIINRVFNFDDISAKDIMKSKTDVYSLNLNNNIETIKKNLSKITYSRIPVIKEDEVIGVLYIKDLFLQLYKGKKISEQLVLDIMRKAYFIDSKIRIDKLFTYLRNKKKHIAIIVENNKYIGIVTMEDVLEELVGDIYDEHDDIT